MPQQERKVNSSSPSFLQRWFGSNELTPEIQKGLDIARSEDPTIKSVQPYGFISRLLQPNAQGYTSPGRNIYLNTSAMQGQSSQEIASTILHEQQHVKQMNDRRLGTVREFLHEAFGNNGLPYSQRPDEMDAYQLEKDRNKRLGFLPPATPSFTTGQTRMPMDVYLPSNKKVSK